MPQTFKALASIAAWTLFIGGLIIGVMTAVTGIIEGQMWTLVGEGQEWMFAWMALSVVSVTLSVVVMRLRQKME